MSDCGLGIADVGLDARNGFSIHKLSIAQSLKPVLKTPNFVPLQIN